MQTVSHIRQSFLQFFEGKGHPILPSAPLIPQNDPTLMFTAAGMVPFKNIFTGTEAPPSPPRATTSQKCVRAGGKHNDLDNVGYTARHHTFFEMLGNFSFGDYFKEQAIAYAWELVTKVYGIPAEKLGITVYHTDDVAFDLWKKIAGLPDSKILRVPTADNFWSAGDTGPCGPCSEIFYDHGTGEGSWSLDSTGHDQFGERYVEIWNLVFMQYEQVDADTRIDLPKPSIDTGSGLERVAAVLQGVHDNYDIDLFRHIIETSQELTGTKAEGVQAPSHKVIADHLRASCFLMADGVLPGNEGRGYVLRRIMRRAMRHAHMLGAREPLMHRMVPTLIAQMGEAFPELKRAQALMTENLRLEEERFRTTLERGLKMLEDEKSKISGKGKLPGDVAFKLYDTYGFPLDLTQDILRGESREVDTEGFNAAMQEQKTRARAAWAGSGDSKVATLWYDLKEQHGASEFLGYTQDSAQAQIMAIMKDGASIDKAGKGDTVQFIANQTPFYGESGGQIGDTGTLKGQGFEAEITNTTKPVEGLFVHTAKIINGELAAGVNATLSIDTKRRARIRANHSATHILHAVLRRRLGEHITQKGSLVAEDRLRFDISHPKGLSREELNEIEGEVNRIIWQNSDVATKLMAPDAAIAEGAMALFGEKYGDEVCVLSMGIDDENGKPYSVELCGGTHVRRTGDIGVFRILSEGAVAAGIRRIEAVTQEGAYRFLTQADDTLKAIALDLKIRPEDLGAKVKSLTEERKKMEKQLSEAKKQIAMGGAGGADGFHTETLGTYQFIGKIFDGMDAKSLRDLATEQAQSNKNTVVALASNAEGKASIIVALSKDILDISKMNAPDIVRSAAEIVGGKGGGGRPDFAQAGGSEPDKLQEAMDRIKEMVVQAGSS